MMTPPPMPNRDRDHLKLLAIFHYVNAGFGVLMLGFIFVHFAIMKTVFGNPQMWENSKEPPPFDPEQFMGVFVWFYVLGGVFQLIFIVLNILSARNLQQQRKRTFSIVVGGLNCLSFPLGTILGIFTIVVLCRDSVAWLYRQHEQPVTA